MARRVSLGAVLAGFLTLGILMPGSEALGVGPAVPIYACRGFEPPMNLASLPRAMGGGVIARKVAKNRVLPFKASLVDADGNLVTHLGTAPRIEVRPDEEVGGPEADVVEYALLTGNGSAGDAFELSGSSWHFNMKIQEISAPGRYLATMASGDTTEYLIDPVCEGVFLIE